MRRFAGVNDRVRPQGIVGFITRQIRSEVMIQSQSSNLRPAAAPSMPDQTGRDSQDRLRQYADEAIQQADEVRHRAGEAAQEAGERLKDAGRQVRDRATEAACETGEQMRTRTREIVSEQKHRLAEQVGVFGQALHRAADTLDENDDQSIGRYVHHAAAWIDDLSDSLQRREVSEMTRGVGDFTRRHPELFLGGLFVAGVAAARFLKASDRCRIEEEQMAYEDESKWSDSGAACAASSCEDIELNAGQIASTAVPSYAAASSDFPELKQGEDIPDVDSPQPSEDVGMRTTGDSIGCNPDRPH